MYLFKGRRRTENTCRCELLNYPLNFFYPWFVYLQKRLNKTSSKDVGDANTDVADLSTNGSRSFVSSQLVFSTLYIHVLITFNFLIVRVRDKQQDGLDSLPKKNESGHHRKRKWEKPSGFIRSKTDNASAEDGSRFKMRKRAATCSSKRSSMVDGRGDGRRTKFSRRGDPRKEGKGGIKHGNRHQKERFGVRRPFKASKSNHNNSSSWWLGILLVGYF